MKKLLLALALVAGTMLIGGSPASATDGQFKTNHTVSVKAGETVTYARSCDESSSHPDGGTAVDGSAEFNETNSADFLSVVSEGITEDGTGYFTQVKNTADRAYAYLSWAVCQPTVVTPPVKGDKGAAGADGVNGTNGSDGVDGKPGKQGEPGQQVTVQRTSQPVPQQAPHAGQGVLPNTGGPNALYVVSGLILLSLGGLIVFAARTGRVTKCP